MLAGLGQPQNHRGDLVVAYDHCGPLNPDPSEALPSPPGAQAKEERGAALGVWESVGAVQSGLRLTLRFPVVNSECSLQRMPAAMEKRKENLVSGTVIGGERLGPTKKVFKTRPLTKKKAQAKAKLKVLADAGEAGGGVAVADRSGVQWRPQAEQAEWLTSTFHSLFGALLSPAEKEPLPGSVARHLLTWRDQLVAIELAFWKGGHCFGNCFCFSRLISQVGLTSKIVTMAAEDSSALWKCF